MGILKGSLSFSRYTIHQELPERFLDFVHQRLTRNAFSGLETSERRKIMGWTGIEDLLDTRFDQARHVKGDYLLFSLRVDRKTVPPSLLKVETMAAEKRYLQETGKERLYREQKQDIRDRIELAILEKSLAVPSFYDICWSISGQWLIFTSLAETARLDFQEMFKASFGFNPVPLFPWEGGGAAGPAATEGAEPLAKDPMTISREFLTWLWFKSEERDGFIALPGRGEIEVIFLRRLVLEGGDGVHAETVICHGMNADLEEGKEALRQGKKIREARIRLRIDADSWEFTFKADLFAFQSLKPPETVGMEEKNDGEGRTLERIYLIERAVRTMDELFALFMGIRTSPDWHGHEQPRILKWFGVRD